MAKNSHTDLDTFQPKHTSTKKDPRHTHTRFQATDGSCERYCTEQGSSSWDRIHRSGWHESVGEGGDHMVNSPGNSITNTKSGRSDSTKHNKDTRNDGHTRSWHRGHKYGPSAGDNDEFGGSESGTVSLGVWNVAAKSIYLGSGTTVAINASGDLEIRAKGNIMMHGKNIFMNGTPAMSGKGGGGAKG